MTSAIPKPRREPQGERSSVSLARSVLRQLNAAAKKHDVQVGSLAEYLILDGLRRIEVTGLPRSA